MNLKRRAKGQGIVEYAGAMVLAGFVVAAVIAAGPANVLTAFSSAVNAVNTYFTSSSIPAST